MEKKTERRALGRGLSALMADVSLDPSRIAPAQAARGEMLVPVARLIPNPDQPRRTFDPEALEELAASLRQKGVIQPLIVREIPGSEQFEIVAGERRWRAAQIARLHDLPVIVRAFSDSEVLEIAIIENIQRADLNAIEEALAYRQLMDRHGHTQEKIAEALSRSRSHIVNLLRLLTLPEDVQVLVREGKISSGHARALITHSNASELARQIVARGLSVRAVEDLVRKALTQGKTQKQPAKTYEGDADTRALEADVAASLKMGVRIDHRAGDEAGRLIVSYQTLDDLDRLCRLLSSDVPNVFE